MAETTTVEVFTVAGDLVDERFRTYRVGRVSCGWIAEPTIGLDGAVMAYAYATSEEAHAAYPAWADAVATATAERRKSALPSMDERNDVEQSITFRDGTTLAEVRSFLAEEGFMVVPARDDRIAALSASRRGHPVQQAPTAEETTSAATITFNLVRTNVFTRWHCDVCGGCTEKVSILCEAVSELPPGHRRLRVCERCIERESASPGHIDRTLKQHAAGLEEEAKELRGLIGQLRVPSYADWLASGGPHTIPGGRRAARALPLPRVSRRRRSAPTPPARFAIPRRLVVSSA